MSEYKGGRLPADPTRPRLMLGRYLGPTAIPHEVAAESTNGQGGTMTITDDDVLAAYDAVSDSHAMTGDNDNGTRMQDVLSYWRKHGIGGHRILAFAQIDTTSPAQLYGVLATFGAIYVGAYDGVGDVRWHLVTSGAPQMTSPEFSTSYVDEAWVVITPEWLDANGVSASGLDLNALGEDFAALTGEPNPFPAQSPTSRRARSCVDVADEALALTAQRWLSGDPWFYTDVQPALRQWLAAKGFTT